MPIAGNKLPVFISLQQIISSFEDNTTLLESLLSRALAEFALVGMNYQFIAAFFLDESGNLQKSFFSDQHSNPQIPTPAENILKIESFLSPEGRFTKDLQAKRSVFCTDPRLVANTWSYDFSRIQTIIFCPVISSEKITGVVVFADTKTGKQIDEEERLLTRMFSNLVGMVYRLQDTQGSLIKITQEVYKMNAQLHQLDKLKDDFVSIASHELRTPMTAIKSYAWMALNRSDVPLTERLKKYLTRTMVSTDRLINLVNDMLNVSRIESGRIEIKPQAFDIIELCKDVLIEVSVRAQEKGVNLSLVEHKIPQTFADPDKVHQILLNLIGNALKFTQKSGSITITFFTDGQMLDISVTDNGVGMVREDLSRLFKKFGRLDNSYVALATSGGTGLGLYISKSLVELMKGKIWVVSEGVGKGSTFTFSLPVATVEVIAEAEKYALKASGGQAKTLEPVAI